MARLRSRWDYVVWEAVALVTLALLFSTCLFAFDVNRTSLANNGIIDSAELFVYVRARRTNARADSYLHALRDFRESDIIVVDVTVSGAHRVARLDLPDPRRWRLRAKRGLDDRKLRARLAAGVLSSDDFFARVPRLPSSAAARADRLRHLTVSRLRMRAVESGAAVACTLVGYARELRLRMPRGFVAIDRDNGRGVDIRRVGPCQERLAETSRAPVRYGDYAFYYLRRFNEFARVPPFGSDEYDEPLPRFEWSCRTETDETPELLPSSSNSSSSVAKDVSKNRPERSLRVARRRPSRSYTPPPFYSSDELLR